MSAATKLRGHFAQLSLELVLMDIHLGGMDGYEATRRICTADPSARVVLVSTYDHSDLPPDALACGAVGYVHKEEFGAPVLRWAITAEAAGR